MNINDFQNLDRGAQFTEAGNIAGTDPQVFDGMWRTESGRGANQYNANSGAEGHFQIMPKTKATMEGRFGQSIDPYNFGQALFTAAHLMKENIGKFKNVPDALRAYNGGWNPSKWGNTETAAYAAKVLGSDDEPVTDFGGAPMTVEPKAARAHAAHDLWNTPATGPSVPATLSKPSKVADAAATLMGLIRPAPDTAPDYGVMGAITAGAVVKQDAEQKLKDDTSFLDSMRASSSLVQSGLKLFFRDPEPIDPAFAAPEEAMKGKTLQEQTELRNSTSLVQFNRMMFDQQDAKDQHDIAFANGTAFGMGAALLADLPGAVITGGVASLAFRGLGVGAFALAEQGRKGAAIASSIGEGALGNVAYTAAIDALGEHQGAEQYAIAVAGGLLNPLLQGRALGRIADRAEQAASAARIFETAKAKQLDLATRAQAGLPAGATSSDIATEMSRLEAEGLRANLTEHKATIPENRRFNVGEDAPEAMPETPAAADMSAESVERGVAKTKDALGSDVAAHFEDPAFQQKRIDQAELNPAWQKQWLEVSGGKLNYTAAKAQLPTGVSLTSDMAELVKTGSPAFKNTVKAIQELAGEYLGSDAKILLSSKMTTAGTRDGAHGLVLSAGDVHFIAIDPAGSAKPTSLNHTAFHELGHTIFHQMAPSIPPELLARINGEWMQFVREARVGGDEARAMRFAPTSQNVEGGALKINTYNLSRDEWMAEQFVKHVQSRMMAGNFGKLSPSVIDQITNGIKAVASYIQKLVNKGLMKPGKATDEFFSSVLDGSLSSKVKADEFMAPDLRLPTMEAASMSRGVIPDKLAKDVKDFIEDPTGRKYGLDMLPMGTPAERAEAKSILAVYKRADAWALANPIDEKRLNKILSRFDAFDPTSNQMLRSKNPVVRMVASELLENGGGAAGRRSSAAIAKFMNERSIIGTVINDLDDNFNAWHKGQPGASHIGEFLTDKRRTEFNRLVAEEIEQRRYPDSQTDFGPSVRGAADAMESSFERARLMQIDAKTIGWAALPESSRGYMPHKMSSSKVRELTPAQQRAVHGALTDQFISIEGFDPTFADQLASKYLDRVRQRALGGFDAPVGIHQTGASDVVREALEQMNLSRPEVDAMMKRYVAGGAGHTKKRLNLDLRQSFANEDGSSFRLLDLFDTNMLSLARGQSQRVSGEVALARHGIMGKPGLAVLRRSMGYGEAGGLAQRRELDAFDQVSAEFLGSPFGVQNKWVDRAMQANSVASLGGMGFNQLGEQINVGMTLGVKAAMSNIASIGRLRAEIKILAKGGKVDNPLLNSLEHFGGAEFGTDAYKMVFPMDLPDAPINTIGADTLHFGDKLLRGAGHLQSKLSLWRTMNALQVRGVAEQIVLKAAKGMREGKADFHLEDMGITQEVFARLKADLPNIARWKGNKLVEFDISKALDKDAANQLVQGVHRGAAQIIQGSFIGESGKYVHNSFLRMLTQFRGFSITAVDKQWNRQKANRGVAGALGMTVAAMSIAAPIYMSRVYLASIGRKDQEEYLDRMISWGAVGRATTNYIATSGMAGDFLDAFTAVTGTGEATGGRSGTNQQLVGNLIAPALGKADKLWGAVQNTRDGTDVHGLIKELPLARLPWLIPAINALGN